jgi:hypothetical protein
MPWPAQIPTLLSRRDGQAAQALRWSLCAMRGCLLAALDEGPNDPGARAARDLVAELDVLLGSPSQVPEAPSTAAQEPSSPHVPRLSALARAVATDTLLRNELGDSLPCGGDDVTIWNEVQRRLLRVSPDLADAWRRRCREEALRNGAQPDDATVTALPVPQDRVLYPGLGGSIQALGLRTTASAPLDARVGARSDDADVQTLAGLVSAALWFCTNDRDLHHSLQGVYRFGVVPMVGEQRDRYVDELLRRWRRVRDRPALPPPSATNHWLKEYLKERIELDEALHSMVYLPPAAPDSWWGWFQAQARLALFRARDRVIQSGCTARLQRLAGSFPAISDLSDDNLHVDHGTPGEVVACLRVYARIDGEEFRGRVLYRPL